MELVVAFRFKGSKSIIVWCERAVEKRRVGGPFRWLGASKQGREAGTLPLQPTGLQLNLAAAASTQPWLLGLAGPLVSINGDLQFPAQFLPPPQRHHTNRFLNSKFTLHDLIETLYPDILLLPYIFYRTLGLVNLFRPIVSFILVYLFSLNSVKFLFFVKKLKSKNHILLYLWGLVKSQGVSLMWSRDSKWIQCKSIKRPYRQIWTFL